ncbi:MAG: flippase [Chloroflexota bacterium]
MMLNTHLGTNSLLWLSARLGSQAVLALFTILIARQLGSAAFGEYAFVVAIVFIGNMVTTFGTDMVLIRDIAARQDYSRLAPSLIIQLSLSAVFIAVTFFSTTLVALKIYSLSLIPLAFFTVFTSVLRGQQRMDLYAILGLTTAVLQLFFGILFIQRGTSIVTVAILLLIVQVAAAFIAWTLCRRQIPHWTTSRDLFISALKVSAPIAVLGILTILYQKISILMVTFSLDANSTGWFSVALRVIEFAKIGHLAVFTALYPAMAKEQNKGFAKEWIVLLFAACALSAFLFLFASPIIFILFGTDYIAAVSLLRLLAWVLIPFTFNTLLVLSFLAIGHERPVLYASSIGLFILVALNMWWIPLTGIVGAGWSLLAAESAQTVVLIFYRNRASITNRVSREFSQST